jgi:hypothetical protein
MDALRPTYFGDTDLTGPYTVRIGEREMTYAVNLLDPVETAVGPADALRIGRARIEARKDAALVNREFWRWLVAAGIAVLALEWWIYSRRAWL